MEYAWNRRWIPTDIGGPDGIGDIARSRSFKALWQLRSSNEGLLLQSIEATPCLILLGEPGMGKSFTVRREWRRLASLSHEHDLVHMVDLLGSDSSQQVREQLFSNETYHAWKEGRHLLTYFIDSVDKTATPVEHVLAAIQNELRTADLYRLRLRLVCRDYDWSLRFADGLRSLWGETSDGASKVHVFQLAPLRYEDICLAAKCHELDPEKFLKDIEAADALALAAIPITLEMLLQTGELTSNRLELYEKGIRRLCRQAEERNVSEKRLSERVTTAASMAAVMLLGDKYWVDIESESIGESALSVRDLLRDLNSENEEKLARETLRTGLFQGDRQRSWIHQSFAEYLAAVYLSAPEITVKEIISLTTNDKGAFATQLYEVLRWLIDMRSDVLEEIVARQPELFLTTDLSHLDDKAFRRVYKAMLSLDDPYIYSSKTWDLKQFRATHPSAAQVLLPYLQDNEDNVYRRRFVLDLLECHGYPYMEDTLVSLALNEYEDAVLRRLAARGLQKVGSVKAKLKLKPYIFGREDDPDDEIKGYALQALWPEQLTAEELFEAVLPPKREDLYGSYKSFLIDESFLGKIEPDDWPVALQWVVAQPSRHKLPFSLQDLPGKIMHKSWDNRHIPGMLEAFARAAFQMTLRYDGIFGGNSYDRQTSEDISTYNRAFLQDIEYRRQILMILLPTCREKSSNTTDLLWGNPPFLIPTDMDWLIKLLNSETDIETKNQLASLVADLFRRVGGGHYSNSEEYRLIEQVYYASRRHTELSKLTEKHFVSVLSDSATSRQKESHYEWKELHKPIDPSNELPDPFEVIEKALRRVEAGETVQWLNVLYGLSINSNIGSSWQIEPDMTEFQNWDSCDDATRIHIVQAAVTYVLNFEYRPCDQNDENWYFTNRISHAEFAGYRAMFLLLKSGDEALQHLPADRWSKWSKIIVWFPYVHIVLNDGRTEHHHQTRNLQRDLLRGLYQDAPRALLGNLRELLISKDSDDSYIGQELDKIEHLWDPALETTLLRLLRDSSLSAKGQRSLLDILLKHESATAASYANEFISSGYANEEQKCLLIEFCTSLMANASKYDWPVIWNAITSSDDLGRAIIEKCAEEDRRASRFGEYLSAHELANLFLWIEERYPSSEDPQIDGFHAVDTREQVGRWRNQIITELRKRDSQEALQAIRRIIDGFPQLEWIQFTRVEIENAVEQLEWQPASPRQILDLAKVRETRLQLSKRKFKSFIKQNWKWIVGFAAKYLPPPF